MIRYFWHNQEYITINLVGVGTIKFGNKMSSVLTKVVFVAAKK